MDTTVNPLYGADPQDHSSAEASDSQASVVVHPYDLTPPITFTHARSDSEDSITSLESVGSDDFVIEIPVSYRIVAETIRSREPLLPAESPEQSTHRWNERSCHDLTILVSGLTGTTTMAYFLGTTVNFGTGMVFFVFMILCIIGYAGGYQYPDIYGGLDYD